MNGRIKEQYKKIMKNNEFDNLDSWKDFVLNVIIERGDATLTDYVWERIEQEVR